MKKFLIRVMFAVMTVSVFSACSDDDEEPIPPSVETPSPTPDLCGYLISVKISPDILSAADVTLQYIDENGKQQQETITETEIHKSIITESFDKTLGYCIKVKEKETIGIETETCRVEVYDNSVFEIVGDDGTLLKKALAPRNKPITNMTFATTNMSKWLSEHPTLMNVAYKVSEDKKNFETATIDWD